MTQSIEIITWENFLLIANSESDIGRIHGYYATRSRAIALFANSSKFLITSRKFRSLPKFFGKRVDQSAKYRYYI